MPRRAHVIVATYNQLPLLRRAMRGWLRQTSPDFALTVADDGSRRDTTEFLENFRSELLAHGIPFRHVWQEDRGFRKTAILNEAVRRSEGEPLLIFSDGDCIPPARFVERHLREHEPWSFHVGGAWRLEQAESEALTESDVDAGRYETLFSRRCRRDLAQRRRKTRWGTMLRLRNRPKMLGLNFAMDRALFEALNGYDERFVSWGLEDSDLRDRAMRMSPRPVVKNLYLANDVFHLWHPRGGPGTRRSQWDYYRLRRPVSCELGLVHRETAAGRATERA